MEKAFEERIDQLNTFQRARFLEILRTHRVCVARIEGLREKTRDLHQRLEMSANLHEKFLLKYWIIVCMVLLAALFFLRPASNEMAALIVLGIALLRGYIEIFHEIGRRHDKQLFENNILEINRNLDIISAMGLHDYYSSEEQSDLHRDILTSLGYDSGLIGGAAALWPLKPAD